jgi:anti-anti-sigma factor
MDTSQSPDAFTLERHGEVTLITATPALETIDSSLEEQVADLIMAPLREQESPMIVFDLSQVDYFGSMFVAVLLRCWKLSNSRGGMMALSGVSRNARELLRLTALDMIWPMYDTSREAIDALLSD